MGTVEVHSLKNSGTLALQGPDGTQRLTVAGDFVNEEGATLETGFAADGRASAIQANTATLNGNLALRPLRDFYASNALITLSSPVQADTLAGSMNAFLVAGNSPTLSFAMESASLSNGVTPTVTVARAKNAYSQYAASSATASTGHALDRIAATASGDMRHLLEALDWSAPDGSGIADGLRQLGAEAYDAAARTSLSQQNEFNLLMLRRMLAATTHRALARLAKREGKETAAQADSARDREAKPWQFWATPYGAGAFQGGHGGHGGLPSFRSTGVGLLAGADRHFESGLDLGFHVALAARRTQVQDGSEAQADTKSAFLGLQAFFAPESWGGFYLMGQGRLGIESGDMNRDIRINGYNRQTESHWSGLAGSLQGGLGFDVRLSTDAGFFTAGPLGFLEYAFLRRPSLDEDEGGAASLRVEEAVYQSLLANLGAHMGWQTTLANGTSLGLDLLAAWRHELLDATLATAASFRDYEACGFDSSSELPGRDSLLVQAGLTLASAKDFTAQLEVGGEFFRTGYTAMNVGLNFSWKF